MIPLIFSLALAQDDAAPAEDVEAAVEEAVGPERSSPPGVIPAEWMDLAEPEIHDLGNGAVAWHVHIPGVRKVAVGVSVHSGTHNLDQWPTELAVQSMNLADVGTASHAPVELEILQDVHDIDLWSWISHHGGGVSLSTPREELDIALDLAREVLHEPAFSKKDVKQSQRDKALWYSVNARSSMGAVAGSALTHAWYPSDHPYGALPDLKAIKKLKSSALPAKQAQWRTSGPVSVLVVGDLAFSEIEPKLLSMLDGLGSEGDWSEELDVPAIETSRVVAVDMPGQTQTALRLRYAAPARTHEDHVAFSVVNWVFGGHFLSRLNANLREDKGFTYGSRSSYGAWDKRGSVTISVDVKAENTAAAMAEIEAEIARLTGTDVTAEELDMARQSFVSDWNGTRETASSARGFYNALLFDRETVAEALERSQRLDDLAASDLTAVASAWFVDQPRVWVIVGDRRAIESQLKGAGVEPEWITPEEAILGR